MPTACRLWCMLVWRARTGRKYKPWACTSVQPPVSSKMYLALSRTEMSSRSSSESLCDEHNARRLAMLDGKVAERTDGPIQLMIALCPRPKDAA
jgi:hypothetical protein